MLLAGCGVRFHACLGMPVPVSMAYKVPRSARPGIKRMSAFWVKCQN